MENCSRPPHSQPRSVFGFRNKGAYDDVFVSRSKMRAPAFTPGVNDYAEIFNCSSSKPSSIPVLELDEFHEREVGDEVMVDYGNVFGGFSDAKIGFAYEDVFSDSARGFSRRANEPHSHSGRPARSTTVEDSQKPPHESLWEKKHSMSSGKITHEGKGDADERNGLGKLFKVPVPGSTFDRTVPPKKASVSSRSDIASNLKQYGAELPVGKHTRSASSSGLPKHGGDGFIEFDKRSRNGSGLDKSVSSDTQMEINIIRPNVQISEATESVYLGGSISTSSDMYKNNARIDAHGGSKKSSEEAVRVRSMHGLDKPFMRDANEDEIFVKHSAVRSSVSPDCTHENGGALRTPELEPGNSIAHTSDRSDNVKGDGFLNSLRDVNFQVVNGSRGAFVKYSQLDASDSMPGERSDLTPAMQSGQSLGNMNTVLEGKVIPEIIDSINVDGESTQMDSNGHLSNGVESKNEVTHVDAKRKVSMSKTDVSKRSTYVSANNSPCSPDDEIDKHSEASVSAAAVEKAIKEARALINVAKESNGVKGFMSLAMAKKSGQVKVAKEECNSKVNENPKFFEMAQSKNQNDFSTSAANNAPGPTRSEMRMASADMVIEGSKPNGTVNKPNQMKVVEMQSSLSKKTLESATTKRAPPTIKSFQEKLAVYGSIMMDQKLAPQNEEVALPGIVAGSEQIRVFSETYSSVVPNVEKRETEVTSASMELFLKNSHESPRKEDVALHGNVAGSEQIRIVPEAYCSVLPNVDKGETEVNSASQESFPHNSPESDTGAGKESRKAMDGTNHGSMMQSFHGDFVKRVSGCSVGSCEVKQNAVDATEYIHTHPNETIKVESERQTSSDLTSFEEENVEESEVEPHGQELDSEDTDSQDYASAEENWVPTDTDEEINDKDHHFSAENNLDEIKEMEHMLVPEVTVISEDITPPSLNNLHEDYIVEETNDVPLQSIWTKEAQASDEKTAQVGHNFDDLVVEETDKSEDMSLPNMVKHDTDATSAEVTTISNEDLIVEEATGSENEALHDMLIPGVKFTSDETTMPFFNHSEEDLIVEEAEISGDASVLFIKSPRTNITSKDGASSSSNSSNGDTGNEIEGTLDMTEQTMVTHEDIIIPEKDIALIYDKSNDDQVEDSWNDTTNESSVSLLNNEHEEGTTGATMLDEQTNRSTEKLDCVAKVETETAFCPDPEPLHHEGSEVDLISTDDLAEVSAEEAIKESVSTPWNFEQHNQETDGTNFCDPDPIVQQDQEELPNDAGIEADVTEECHEIINVKGFKNDNAFADDAGKEDAAETESTSWNSEHVNSEPEADVQISEPLSDPIKYKETTEVEQLSEDFLQQAERHERRKWDISREKFELPKLEIGVPDIQDTLKQDSSEIERQMDKHERKKWEIPRENFELPVLGDEAVKDNEENARRDTEGATQSAEKPERKKWKIQKEVFVVPILCSEALQDPPDHEGFVIKTPSAEEMGMTHNSSNAATFPEEMLPHEEVHDEFSVNADAVPGEAASCELRSKNSQEEISKESVPDNKMLSEEPSKQLGETSDQQYNKIGEGKSVEQEDCRKGTEDINVKDEIKRTLGMLWKKIYNIKQDEASESAELAGKENVNVNDTMGQGITMDLNLKGPVQLVESPRQLDDMETLIFSGNRKRNEDSSESPLYTEPFKENESSIGKSREFVSLETKEVQRSSPLAFDSCKYQKGDSEETENYNANHPESRSDEGLSDSESESCTEMAPTHEVCDLKKEGTPKDNIQPSNVYESRQMDYETVVRSKHVTVDENMVDNAESTQKTEVLQQDELNEVQDDISDENLSEVEVEMDHVDNLSDKRCADSEQHDTNINRQDMESASDSDVPDVTLSHGFEQRIDKDETCPDKIEQASNWKWIFGDEMRDRRDEQDEVPDVKKLREVKGKTKEMADDNDISHVSRKVKIDGDKPTLMGDTVPNRRHKEVTPDQDVLKNLMREKELERIAVERAIREARERAFIEARERAAMERANAVARETSAKEKANLESREKIALERANAEVRERAAVERANADAQQKVNSNGQERSQRLSSEAKLASERNSLEAKRRAELERAAVERATVEARQRALEKAMSRKEQVTESSSKSASTSSDQSGSASKERLNEDKPSESALRFKARNERHQRIAERASKALAEKNMRDLLVQKEQAERNRLAEVLDADVKRWARGKTGNLRALLSTLQYVLGPDSGWQAIHLTEIVTADAVKKAYRKATLFVHPDKLQQRGATIRQKYICEKVFDLLKEAWNKFDRDER